MKDEDLLRYSRQIALPEIDISGQSKISQSKVIVIGLGGLGRIRLKSDPECKICG